MADKDMSDRAALAWRCIDAVNRRAENVCRWLPESASIRRRPWLRSFLPKPFISRLSNRWWHRRLGGRPLSGRQPPKAGAVIARVTTRQRMHIRLRIELFLPVILYGRCRRQVVICRRYDRGQVYCGPDCALEVRSRNQREARRRYQATGRGRRLHIDRSREYRARGRGVTDQGPTPNQRPKRVAPPRRQRNRPS
jgi:hypothetical protein